MRVVSCLLKFVALQMVLVGCSSIYVSVYYPKPTSNLCNLFCDEFSYFMQFVCLLCTLTAKPFVVAVAAAAAIYLYMCTLPCIPCSFRV